MRILVIGATGLLGRVLLEEPPRGGDQVIGVGSREVDIRKPIEVDDLFAKFRPDWAVLAAAYTDVDGCEKDPERAHQVNCLGALQVCTSAREHGSKLIFVSTDFVFDGEKAQPYEPEDVVAPKNVYGHSKVQAEEGIRKLLPDACIVRTSWLFGATGRCFPNTILELAQSRKKLTVVADQIGCPTFNRDLAHIIFDLMQAGARGTIHATNAGSCSWYAFACAIIKAAGITEVSVEPVSAEDFPRPARRPKYSVLSQASLAPFGLHPRTWQTALKEYFTDRDRAAHLTRLSPQGPICQ